jgi:hypothetical protein
MALTQEQIKQGYSTIPGNYDPVTGNVITPKSLSPEPKTQLGSPAVDDTNYAGITGGVSEQLANTLNGVTAERDAQAKLTDKSGSDLSMFTQLLGNEPLDLINEQNTQGVNELTKKSNDYYQQVLDLNAQASGLNREAQAIPIQTQEQFKNTGATDRGVAPITTGKLRENALRALSIAQQSDIANAAYTGSVNALNSAKEKAQQIVDIKYAQIEAQLKTRQIQYEMNKDILDRYDKKRSEALGIALKREERDIAEQKQNEKDIQNLALTAISTGNAPSDILASVSGKSIEEAITTLAPYLKTQNTDVIKLDNGSTLLIDKNSGQIIKNYGGAKPKEVSGVTGISPVVASTFGTLINTTSNLEDTVAGKTAIKEQLASMLNAGDYNGAYNQIANSVAKGLTGETKNRFENARIDYEVMSGFKGALQQYINAGGDTGLLKGTAESITRKLGQVTDPKLTALAVQLQREFQTYRNTMTGAAFTPKESAEYASVNPTVSKSLNLNLAVVDGALNQLKNRVDGTIRAKVPQAGDIQKLLDAPRQAEQAKQTVNTLYQKVDADVKAGIEKLINQGVSDEDIIDYLQLKGIQ